MGRPGGAVHPSRLVRQGPGAGVFVDCVFVDCDLTEVTTRGATFDRCEFRGVQLNASTHERSRFTGCLFAHTSFFTATFRGCKLTGSEFVDVTLRPITVEGGDWSYVQLRGADLRGLVLADVNLQEADLSEANLHKASLAGSNLGRATLRSANITEADLTGADLVGVDLAGLSWRGTKVDGLPGPAHRRVPRRRRWSTASERPTARPDPADRRGGGALAAERREVLALLADLTRGHGDIVAAALDSNLDDEHDPEGATIAFERAQVDALMGQARHRLQEVDAAGAPAGRAAATAGARLRRGGGARPAGGEAHRPHLHHVRVGQPSQFEGSIGAGVSTCRREPPGEPRRPDGGREADATTGSACGGAVAPLAANGGGWLLRHGTASRLRTRWGNGMWGALELPTRPYQHEFRDERPSACSCPATRSCRIHSEAPRDLLFLDQNQTFSRR